MHIFLNDRAGWVSQIYGKSDGRRYVHKYSVVRVLC